MTRMPFTPALGAAAVIAALGAAAPASAEYERIESRSAFSETVVGRKLTRFGIEVTVTPGGEITGSAFGRSVGGRWEWREGFFCRELSWGDQTFGGNCQTVMRDGTSVRFTSDRGSGRSADLTLN